MKIVVAVTNVIDLTQPYHIPTEESKLTSYVPTLNPWDEFALEAALQIKEKYGAELIAISVGELQQESALRKALALGCDSALRIENDSKSLRNDQIASILAAAIRKIGDVDIAFCGRQSIDIENGTTASMLAERLNWPYLSLISKVEAINHGIFTAQKSFFNQLLTISVQFPIVVSASKEFGEARFPSFMGMRRAARAVIESWPLLDLRLELNQIFQADSRIEKIVTGPILHQLISEENEVNIANILDQKVSEALS